MRRVDQEPEILPSILDRLVDGKAAQTLEELKRSVARDLEALLNTCHGLQREVVDAIPRSAAIRHSLLTYGLPDFTSFNRNNKNDWRVLCREIEEAVRIFEPRLDGISVTLETPQAEKLTLRFAIKASLLIEPLPENVVFNAAWQFEPPEAKEEGSAYGKFVVRG